MLCVYLLALVALAASQCPQDLFQTRLQYDLVTKAAGFDIKWWFRGRDLIGTSTGAPMASMGTSVLINEATAGQQISSSTLEILSKDQLRAIPTRDQYIVLYASLTTTATQGCVLSLGGDVTPTGQPALCILKAGVGGATAVLSAPGFFELPLGTLASTIVINIRRFLGPDDKIYLDIFANAGSVVVDRQGLPGEMFDVAGSSVIVDTPKSSTGMSTTTLNNIILLQGRPRVGQTLAAMNTAATPFIPGTQACLFETWTVPNGFVVPSKNFQDTNLELTYTRTNFGPLALASAPVSVRFSVASNPAKAALEAASIFISNFTAPVTVTGGTFDPTNVFSGAAASVYTPNNLAVGESSSLTFKASVANCTITALPLSFATALPARFANGVRVPAAAANSIQVGSSDAYIFIQRQAELLLVYEDKRPFDQVDRVIPTGCGVPLTYTVDIFNNGPSCVTDLSLNLIESINVGGPISVTAGNGGIFTQPGNFYPGVISSVSPVQVSIATTEGTPDFANVPRYVTLLAPGNGGINSINSNGTLTPERIATFADRFQNPLFKLTYDTQLFADMSIRSEQIAPAIGSQVAGNANDLVIRVTVESHSCTKIDNVTIDVEIELPAGVAFKELLADGSQRPFDTLTTSNFIRRTYAIGSFAPNQVKTFDFRFVVCPEARAGVGGVRLIARFSSLSPTDFGDVHDFETTAFAQRLGAAPAVPKYIHRDDDETQIVAQIVNQANLAITQLCTDPKIVPHGVHTEFAEKKVFPKPGFLQTLSAESESSSSSSSSSDSVPDVSIQKFSRCTLTVQNNGISDAWIKIQNMWDLPEGVHVAGWQASTGVFSDNVWILDATSFGTSNQFGALSTCNAKTTQVATLTVDIVANRHGIVQWVTAVDEKASPATITGSKGGFQSIVF